MMEDDEIICQMKECEKQTQREAEKDRRTDKIVVILNRLIITGLIVFLLFQLQK